MITKEKLETAINEFYDKMEFVEKELESLYQRMANSKNEEVINLAKSVENIQFNGFASPCSLKYDNVFNEVITAAEENEKIKDLSKFIAYERVINSIKKELENIDSNEK